MFASVLKSVRVLPEQPKRLARMFFDSQFLTRCLESKKLVALVIQYKVYFTTGPNHVPKRVPYSVRHCGSSFNFH